jgi:hypothetical protein
MKKPMTLPSWMTKVIKPGHITQSSMDAGHLVLLLALSLRLHDSADEIRDLCRRVQPQVPMGMVPNMKRLAREPDDEKVFEAALLIINKGCMKMGIAPDVVFVRNDAEPEKPPFLTEDEVMDQLKVMAAEISDATTLARLINEMVDNVPEHMKGALYVVAGSKNPRATIHAAVRDYQYG